MCRSYGAKIYLNIVGYKHDAPTELKAVLINVAINITLLRSYCFLRNLKSYREPRQLLRPFRQHCLWWK